METDVVVDPEVRPPEVLFDLSGRVAVVTGASSGLGRRFARVLHAAGAHVVLAARRQDRLVKLAAELNDLPGRARVVVQACDVTDEVATQALVDRTVAEFGSVDVLVNNAGLGEAVRAIDETNDHVRATLEVNLVGLFTLSRQAAAVMLEAGSGSIVNIASMLGLVASAPVQQAALRSEGRRGQPDPPARRRVGPQGRAGERDRPGLVPFRDDRRNDVRRSGGDGVHRAGNPDGTAG